MECTDNEEVLTYEQCSAHGCDLRKAGNYLAAAEAYRKAAELRPNSNAGLFRAMSIRESGDVEAAIQAYQTYIDTNPNDIDGWVGLGVYMTDLNRYDEAIAPLQHALTLKNDPVVRNPLVGALWRTNRMDEAIAEGMKNLILKDQRAFETFRASTNKDIVLRSGGRGWDPGQREKNIVAFSLWGDSPEYVTGAIVNAQIAQHMYVCWTARFYCDTSVPADAREALKAYGAQVILMDRPEHARIRPMWRFLASDDPNVNVFVCRDTDSRLNPKEVLGVTEWLRSGKRFHVMRDHIYHHELILAGMWGGMAGVLPSMEECLMKSPQYFDNKFADQAFLADLVWPLIREDCKVHDTEYRFPNAGPFPDAYDLPGLIHVGGGQKHMPHWSQYVQRPRPS